MLAFFATIESIFVTPAILSNNPDHIAIKVIKDERTESITLTQNIVAHKFLPVFSNFFPIHFV